MKKIWNEEQDWLYDSFKNCVNQERRWAEYLFKEGSMIGLNDKLLCQYVEWVANRRLKAIGLKPSMIFLPRTILSLGPSTGFLLRVFRLLHKKLK
jgi:ribonucleotide reductase beta subunit family protein with ferritin-like domain